MAAVRLAGQPPIPRAVEQQPGWFNSETTKTVFVAFAIIGSMAAYAIIPTPLNLIAGTVLLGTGILALALPVTSQRVARAVGIGARRPQAPMQRIVGRENPRWGAREVAPIDRGIPVARVPGFHPDRIGAAHRDGPQVAARRHPGERAHVSEDSASDSDSTDSWAGRAAIDAANIIERARRQRRSPQPLRANQGRAGGPPRLWVGLQNPPPDRAPGRVDWFFRRGEAAPPPPPQALRDRAGALDPHIDYLPNPLGAPPPGAAHPPRLAPGRRAHVG